jgi:hypothetical protein
MAVRKMKALKALAVFLIFGFTQVYVQAGLGSPGSVLPQARLIAARVSSTRNNQPILINGTNAGVGQSVLTGAMVETGDQVSATIDISPLGSFDIGPNSRVQLDFNDSGFRLKVFRGCVAVKSKGNEIAEAYTEQGASEKTDSNRKAFGVCYLNGQFTPEATQAASAGAGLGGTQVAAIAVGIGVTVTAIAVAVGGGDSGRGANPSP